MKPPNLAANCIEKSLNKDNYLNIALTDAWYREQIRCEEKVKGKILRKLNSTNGVEINQNLKQLFNEMAVIQLKIKMYQILQRNDPDMNTYKQYAEWLTNINTLLYCR